MTHSSDIQWHPSEANMTERENAIGQRGVVLWFTGLSGSGKSTVARRVERMLLERAVHTYVLDGDNLRHGLNGDLGFTSTDRTENIRRVGCVAQLMCDAGLVCIAALIAPFQADRAQARTRLPEGRFIEVFIDTPLSICEQRDPKGLYKKARSNEIPHFTGISSPYEAPVNAEIHLHTEQLSVDRCAQHIIAHLETEGFISKLTEAS